MLKLETSGDQFEKDYWPLFVKNYFPSYQKFWLKFVVPLTNRPNDINFKTDAGLETIGKSHRDLCIAQLNYSILRHLIRCFQVKEILEKTIGPEKIGQQLDLLSEGLTRLVGAQDNAFELLERMKTPQDYQPFISKDGYNARKKWQKNNSFPLQNIRDYRNSLVHGRLLPGILDGQRLCLPGVEKEDLYLDWRIITDPKNNPGLNKDEFISVLNILDYALGETLNYLEKNWVNL